MIDFAGGEEAGGGAVGWAASPDDRTTSATASERASRICYPRWTLNEMSSVMSCRIEFHTEQYLLARQRDRPRHHVVGRRAVHIDVQIDGDEPARMPRRPPARQRNPDRRCRNPRPLEEVDDVHPHAPGQRKRQRLHRRRTRGAGAVHDRRGLSRPRREPEIARPRQFTREWRAFLGHGRYCRTLSPVSHEPRAFSPGPRALSLQYSR